MPDETQVLKILNEHYSICFDELKFLRDSGCVAYTAFSGGCKYFLRVTKPAFSDTTVKALDIHLFLQNQGFSVPQIIFTGDGLPYVLVSGTEGDSFCVLYEFVEGEEVNPMQDAEIIGAFVGQLHHVMKKYPGELTRHDKQFYINRYIDIMRTKQYDKVDEFIAYGDALWERVKDLPYGYCHGDMYWGNILKTPGGRLYLLDFDTFCEGFRMYDPALICNMTDFF